MSEIKLVLTDFDGTVAQFGKHIVSERVREAVIACENKVIRMVPVTGRYYAMARPVLEVLGFEDLGVFDNGATIQSCKTGETIWSKQLEPELVKQVARTLAPFCRIIDYAQVGDEHEVAENENELIDMVAEPVSSIYGLVHARNVEQVSSQLAQIPGLGFYTAPSTRDHLPDFVGFQVTHELADKFHGVNALRDIVGIDKEHTLAIGDGDNDIPLFNNARLKIAMGNATDLLKAEADFVVSSVEADGFAEAMERFVLN